MISATLVSIGTSLSGRALTSLDKSVITSVTSLAALCASPAASAVADAAGRRPVILCADALFVLGAALQALATGVPVMVAGRAVVGAAVSSELRELIATMHRREDPVISASDLLGWTSHDVTGRLADIECPLVLVGGSDDLWLDLDAMRETAASVKRSTTVVLDGIGHYPPQEMTDFADVLHGWIQDCLAQAVRS